MPHASKSQLVPLTPVKPAHITDILEEQLHAVSRQFNRQPGIAEEKEQYSPHRLLKLPDRHTRLLHVDDFSPISNIQGVVGLPYYTSRAFTRARDKDIVAATIDPIAGHDDYMARRLQLGRPYYLQVPPPSKGPAYATFTALLEDDESFRRLADLVQASQSFVIHPYMGVPDAWRLAEKLQRRSNKDIGVLSPLPIIASLVNNKTWLLNLVQTLHGSTSTVVTRQGLTPREVSSHLKELAHHHNTIAVKLSDSASGMGTGLFDSKAVLSKPPQVLENHISRWLKDHSWQAGLSPPVSVEVWEKEVLASPSSQLWPPLEEGPPVVEGIFEQMFDDSPEQVFMGSISSQLPQPINQAIATQSAHIGRVLQYLGYVGRCSFDTILVGESINEAEIKFVECNGRWGGTSTPMSLMNRLYSDYRTQPYQAADFISPSLQGMEFSEFLKIFDDILYSSATGQGWAIVYNVGCLQPRGKLDVITLGESSQEARQRQEEFARLVVSRC
jgi:hypothetical protein